LGIVSIGLGAKGYFDSPYNDFVHEYPENVTMAGMPGIGLEDYFLGTTMTFLFISTVYLFLYSILDELVEIRLNRLVVL